MKIKAAVVKKAGDPFTFEDDIELHKVGPTDLLVRLVASGICLSDEAIRSGEASVGWPAILGHEGSGIVEEVGSNVTDFAPGDHVILSYWTCGKCDKCLAGHAGQCRNYTKGDFMGVRPDGDYNFSKDGHPISNMLNQSSFATATVVEQRNAIKVDKDLDLRKLGPLGCGYVTGSGTVLNALQPRPGQTIAVFGTGAVGLAAMMAAKISGCTKIIAIDRNDPRLALAKELGATDTINTNITDPVKAIKGLTNGYGVDFSIDTTGAPAITKAAIDSLTTGGTCAGVAVTSNTVNISEWGDLSAFDKRFIGVLMGDSVPQLDIPRLVEFYKLGWFPFDKTEKFYDFSQINEANEDSKSGKVIKPVLIIDKKYQPGN